MLKHQNIVDTSGHRCLILFSFESTCDSYLWMHFSTICWCASV